MSVSPDNPYTKMQKAYYEGNGRLWTPSNPDHVVGSWFQHIHYRDYEYLFTGIDTKGMVALDFGCGPGRNIVQHSKRFKRIDGVDISETLLAKAKRWAARNGIKEVTTYSCNGVDLANVPSDTYDFVMSSICMQHICVHEIRYNYFKEFLRVLKPEGWIGIQMGFGPRSPASVDYYANYYEAKGTNRAMDTRVESPDQLEKDLTEIGFASFRHWLRPPGPAESHRNWIFFQAQKPK